MRGRRRAPPKRAPKNIFSPGAKKEQKKVVPQPPPKVQAIAPPKPITPPKVAGSVKEKKIEDKPAKPKKSIPIIMEKTTKKVENVVVKEIDEDKSKEIISDQILGNNPKKTRGLKQIKKKDDDKSKDLNVQSDRAAALIEQSKKRAMQPVVAESVTPKKTTKPVVTKRLSLIHISEPTRPY